MIYIDISQQAHEIYVPHNGWPGQATGLVAVNTVEGGDGVEIPIVSQSRQGAFVILVVTVPTEIHEGEYEYRMTMGENKTATGLLRVQGEAAVEVVQYDEQNEVIQYGDY